MNLHAVVMRSLVVGFLGVALLGAGLSSGCGDCDQGSVCDGDDVVRCAEVPGGGLHETTERCGDTAQTCVQTESGGLPLADCALSSTATCSRLTDDRRCSGDGKRIEVCNGSLSLWQVAQSCDTDTRCTLGALEAVSCE